MVVAEEKCQNTVIVSVLWCGFFFVLIRIQYINVNKNAEPAIIVCEPEIIMVAGLKLVFF